MTKTKKKQTETVDEKPGALTWLLEPIEEKWGMARVHVWTSKCGLYKVYRVEPVGDSVYYSACKRTAGSWWWVEHAKLGPGYPKKYGDLVQALYAAEKHYAEGKEPLESNRGELLAQAISQGFVSPARAHAPLRPTGGDGAEFTPSARHTRANAMEKGKGRARGPVNEWGAREGTNEAKAVAILTTEPKNMKTIMRDAGITSTVYSFMNKLASQGKINKSTEGFFLKK